MMDRDPNQERNSTSQKSLRLMMCVAVLIVAWTILLPALARVPSVAAHIRNLKEQKIHADAMFYTELEDIPRLNYYASDEPTPR